MADLGSLYSGYNTPTQNAQANANVGATLATIGQTQADTQSKQIANTQAQQLNPLAVQKANIDLQSAKLGLLYQITAGITPGDQNSVDNAHATVQSILGPQASGQFPTDASQITPQFLENAKQRLLAMKGQLIPYAQMQQKQQEINNTANIDAAAHPTMLQTDGAGNVTHINAQPTSIPRQGSGVPLVPAAVSQGQTQAAAGVIDPSAPASSLSQPMNVPAGGAGSTGASALPDVPQGGPRDPSLSLPAGGTATPAVPPQAAPQGVPSAPSQAQPVPAPMKAMAQGLQSKIDAINAQVANHQIDPDTATKLRQNIIDSPEGDQLKAYNAKAGANLAEVQDSVDKIKPAVQSTLSIISQMKKLNDNVPSGDLGGAEVQNLINNNTDRAGAADKAADTAKFNQLGSEALVNAVHNFTASASGSRLDLPVASSIIKSKGIPQALRPEARDALLNQQAVEAYNSQAIAKNVLATKTGGSAVPLAPLSTPAFNDPSDPAFSKLASGSPFINLATGSLGWKH